MQVQLSEVKQLHRPDGVRGTSRRNYGSSLLFSTVVSLHGATKAAGEVFVFISAVHHDACLQTL